MNVTPVSVQQQLTSETKQLLQHNIKIILVIEQNKKNRYYIV